MAGSFVDVWSDGMFPASMFGADDRLGEGCCAAQEECKGMPENVARQMRFWEKGSVCLNQEVQCVIDPCLKAHVCIPVLNGHTQRQGKKPAVVAA